MKYYFPLHLDGGNRGCEGIAKGTAKILGLTPSDLVGLCRNVPLDRKLNIDEYVIIQATKKPAKVHYYLQKALGLLGIKYRIPSVDNYTPFIGNMSKEDVMISTGGDMMCYDNNQAITTNEIALRKGVRTVLWGCSMGKNNLTPEKESTLRKFSLIYARETLSYEFFKSIGIKNVICLPDPAFVLDPEPVPLPTCFNDKEVIGLNISNYTVGADSLNTSFGEEISKLLDFIFKETNYNILLVPHVLWNKQDDRLLSSVVMDKYKQNGDRVSVLDSGNLNYLQIRHVISHCRIFIGGRTHAVVSAYSTCVPTIALGYSIKSKGIAKDVGLPESMVVDTKNIKTNALINAFKDLDRNYSDIKTHLKEVMPEYKKRPYEIINILKELNLYEK